MRTILVSVAAAAVLWAFTGFSVEGNENPPQKEKHKRGWLGVSIQDVTEELVGEKNLASGDGAYVADVVDDSPADSVGLKEGDIIVEFNGRKIYDADDLAKSVSRLEPGTRASLVSVRNGERKTHQVVVGKIPRKHGYAFKMGKHPELRMFHGGAGMLGINVLSLNEQLARYFGAPNDEGVLVEKVEEDSPAAKGGLMAGDVILRVGSKSVDEVRDIWKGLEKYEEGDKVEVEVLRKGSKKTLTVVLEEMEDGPWGYSIPPMPKIHVFPRHGEDFDFNFDVEVAPELERIERKLEQIGPRIEKKSAHRSGV